MAPDPHAITAAHSAYQRGRAKLALTHAAPALAYTAVALLAGSDPRAVWFGMAAFLAFEAVPLCQHRLGRVGIALAEDMRVAPPHLLALGARRVLE